MWLEQLALDPWARALVWAERPSSQDVEKFTVAVIGAGMAVLTPQSNLSTPVSRTL